MDKKTLDEHLEKMCPPGRPLSVADEAAKLVEGHRQADYGHPSIDLGRTAKLWTALFDYQFSASDVAQAMRMVKESRLRNSPRHRDSLIDIVGYALAQEMIWEDEPQTFTGTVTVDLDGEEIVPHIWDDEDGD